MKKYEIVKKNTEFNDIINKGKFFKNKYYIIYYNDSEDNFPKFGLAVSKRCGNAVNRNYIKRQLRMMIDMNKKLFQIKKNYIIMVRKEINDLNYQEREYNFINLLKERNNK